MAPENPRRTNASRAAVTGTAYGFSAYLIWGISPIYWKLFNGMPALEIITHRVVWSFLFLVPLVWLRGRGAEFAGVFRNRRTLMILAGSSLLVALNWLIYIWAVTHGRILQASLGYYINPLVNVLLGLIFLRERLGPARIAAVLLAAAGVGYLTVHYGVFPWVSLALAFSFGLYGLIRKVAPVGALTGLTVEVLLLTVPGLLFLAILHAKGTGAFLRTGPVNDLLLMGASLVTAVPLLLFTMGARRLHLATMGFLQYIAPTCMFLIGVLLYGEPFSRAQAVTFGLIWTALLIYSADSIAAYRQAAKIR